MKSFCLTSFYAGTIDLHVSGNWFGNPNPKRIQYVYVGRYRKVDKETADAIQAEIDRQNSHIELIASENWANKAVMSALGSMY